MKKELLILLTKKEAEICIDAIEELLFRRPIGGTNTRQIEENPTRDVFRKLCAFLDQQRELW